MCSQSVDVERWVRPAFKHAQDNLIQTDDVDIVFSRVFTEYIKGIKRQKVERQTRTKQFDF